MRLFLSSSRNLAATMSVICLILCLALSGAGAPARALAAGNVAFGAADTGWQRVALPGMRVKWLAAAPANPALIYAGVESAGVYVSNDGGETWSMLPASGLTNLAVQTITVCPSGTPYVGTWGSGVFRFSSGSWQRASDGLRNDYITAVSCDDQGALLAGTYSDGVFRSTDGGRLWSSSNTGLGNPQVTAVQVSGNRTYAGTPAGTYRSTDAGQTWRAAGLNTAGVLDLDLAVPGQVLAATTQGIFRSRDDGANWSRLGNPLDAYTVAQGTDTRVYAGTKDDGGYVFDGANWIRLDLNASRIYYLRSINRGASLLAGTAEASGSTGWSRTSTPTSTPTPTSPATPTATPTPRRHPRQPRHPGTSPCKHLTACKSIGAVENGAEITYTIDIETVGGGILHDVVISNAIPFNTELIPGSIDPPDIGSSLDGKVFWTLGIWDP